MMVLPWAMLFIALPLSFVIWTNEKNNATLDQRLRFDYRAKEARDLITQQLMVYEKSLYGVQSFFKASDFVTESEFSEYVSILLNTQKFDGLKEVGFIKYVDTNQPATYQPFSQYVGTLVKQAQSSTTATMFAPFVYTVPKQRAGVLFDAFEHADLKAHMLLAAKEGRPYLVSISRQNSQINKDAAFLVVLPVYNNHADRQYPIYGWVTVKVATEDFLNASLTPLLGHQLAFKLYDSTNVRESAIVYDSGPPAKTQYPRLEQLQKQHYFNVMGHDWLLVVDSLPAYHQQVDFTRANMLGAICLLVSLVLAGIFYLLASRLRTLDAMQRVSQQLLASEQRWQFALEGAGDGVWDWDIANHSVLYSKRWKQMLGYQEDEIEEDLDEWRNRVHPDDREGMLRNLNAVLENTNQLYADEFRMRCKDGDYIWMLARGMVFDKNADGFATRMVGTLADISNLKATEESVRQHANFDMLTSLPNRRMFYVRLNQEIQKAKRTGLKIAILFLDLDGFKEVNDTLGHDQGDVLLNVIGRRLTDSMRGADSIARLGGDEFVLIISDIDESDLKSVELIANKVLKLVAEPVALTQEIAYVSASIGIAIYPDDANKIEDLMKNVDQAMYASKQRGGNCFSYFTSKMQELAIRRMQLANDLRGALARQEFFLEYQPIVDLSTNRIYKAEALIRWQHPVRGLVSPVDFIPVAEYTRQIGEIGNWVFEEVFKQVVKWNVTFDVDFQVAVNKSPVQFNGEDERSHKWLEEVRNNPSFGPMILIEITEGLLLDATEKVKERIKLFQSLGIQMAIDDFGTGYSSLSYLKKFDINFVKIDRSFVMNLTEDSEDYVLCKAMIVMAHSLGLQVVAEGIETELQRNLLLQAGCDFGQGYYYSKALPIVEFEAFVRRYNQ